jgi:lipid II:glycine glycyltransferase (peptidoglycan interpeptide bridge formation enzyme)
MPIVDGQTWDVFIAKHPNTHILQTSAWGELKADFGWYPRRLIAGETGAQVLFRELPLGFTVAYIPRGPVGAAWEALWPELDQLCRQEKAIFLKVAPDFWEGEEMPALPADFQASTHFIQPPRTITIDINGEEDDILVRMKSKTRYNIRLAERKDVVVKTSADVEAYYNMMEITGQRDEFGVHSLAYYQRAYELFHPLGLCELFIAEYEGTPLAGLIAFANGERAWYFYGASTNQERNRMPTYLIQWAAIKWARAKGCTHYDLWGVPDYPEETLEADFTERSEGLWGVYRFKRGFGGEVKRAIGVWDKVYRPALYRAYRIYVER